MPSLLPFGPHIEPCALPHPDPLMIPFCWVLLQYENYRPREGHSRWILGMLMVLVSVLAVEGPTPGD
jgi:hypothetical protein